MLSWGLRETEGAYANASPSGLLTTVAAGTATAGHVWAFRWPTITAAQAQGGDARQFAVIQRIRVRAWTITGFTAAQEVRLALFKLTGYSVSHTGGVAAVVPTKKRTGNAVSGSLPIHGVVPASRAVIQVGNTGELTAGTQTIDADPIRIGVSSELAAAATVQKGVIDMEFNTEDKEAHPIILQGNEGLLLRNEVLMGAAGTMRLAVEVDWLETERQAGMVSA